MIRKAQTKDPIQISFVRSSCNFKIADPSFGILFLQDHIHGKWFLQGFPVRVIPFVNLDVLDHISRQILQKYQAVITEEVFSIEQ